MSSEGNWPPETALFTLRATVAHVSAKTLCINSVCILHQDTNCMRPRNLGSIPRRKKKLFSDTKLPEKLWAPKASYSKVLGTISSGEQSSQGVKLTTHLHLVPRLRMRGAIHPLPPMHSWRAKG